jgi:negative regulator of sigma E activity
MTMSTPWQNVVVAAAVVAAVAWLVRDWRRRRAAKASCDKCALMRPPPHR